MNILSKLIGEKKQWREYKVRKKHLPANYRAAVDAMERHIFSCGPESGEATMRALDDLIDLFEQGAAAMTPSATSLGKTQAISRRPSSAITRRTTGATVS